MWCSFHKSTTHSDETCRTLQQQLGNNGSANCANQGSDYPAVLTASDPPPGSNIEEQGISFAAVEVPTKDEPSTEESFWPFGSTGEAVASFDTSGFFRGFGGATSEDTESSTFEIEEGPPGTGALEPYHWRACSYHGLVWSLFQRPQRRDHQLGSAGTGDSDPHHWYPGNDGLCFDNGGYAPLRLAHPRQLPLQPSCIDEHQRAARNLWRHHQRRRRVSSHGSTSCREVEPWQQQLSQRDGE